MGGKPSSGGGGTYEPRAHTGSLLNIAPCSCVVLDVSCVLLQHYTTHRCTGNTSPAYITEADMMDTMTQHTAAKMKRQQIPARKLDDSGLLF